jgi:hypothetical protein
MIDDPDLTFFMNVYRDFALAQRSISAVRLHYPKARLVVVSDGDDDRRYEELGRTLAFEYVKGERLIGVEHGGAFVDRMLRLFLKQPTPYLLKIDTDTIVHRRLRSLPTDTCVFGTLEHYTAGLGEALDPPNVQGGCIGLTVDAARLLADAGVFSAAELLDPFSTWALCTDMIFRVRRRGLVSDDFLLRYGCAKLSIVPVESPEIHSLWWGCIENPGLRYAITHPHKDLNPH